MARTGSITDEDVARIMTIVKLLGGDVHPRQVQRAYTEAVDSIEEWRSQDDSERDEPRRLR